MKSKLLIGLAFLGFISLTSCKKICQIFCADCNDTTQCNPPPDKKSYLDSQVVAYNPSPVLIHFLDSVGYKKKDSCNCTEKIELWAGNKSAEEIIGLVGNKCPTCNDGTGDLSAVDGIGFNFKLDFGRDSIIRTRVPASRGDTPILKSRPVIPNIKMKNGYPGQSTFLDIGIIDSGEGGDVDVNELRGNLWINPNSVECLMNSYTNGIDVTTHNIVNPIDVLGHGNTVNCIALGYPGDMPLTNVRVLNAKILNTLDSGSLFKALCGSFFALEHGAQILNMSWGFRGTKTQMPKMMIPFFKKSLEKGVLIVAAAGNNSSNIDSLAFWPASFNSLYPNIITVGGLNENQNALWIGSNFGNSVDIYAKAENVHSVSLNGNLQVIGKGTSFAAPRVAHELAKIITLHRDYDIYQVKDELLNNRTSNLPSTAYKKLNSSY